MGPPLLNVQAATSQVALTEAASSAVLGGMVSYVMPRAVASSEGPVKSKSRRALKDGMYSGAAALINNGTSIGYYLPASLSMSSPVPVKALSEGLIFAGISMIRGPKQRSLRSALMNFAVGTVVATASQKIVVPYFAGPNIAPSISALSTSTPSNPTMTSQPGFAS